MRDSKDSTDSKWKKYSVSKLNPTSSSVDSLPVITIRPRRNDIFIPSVHKSDEVVTPRSADTADGSGYSSLSVGYEFLNKALYYFYVLEKTPIWSWKSRQQSRKDHSNWQSIQASRDCWS